MGKKPKKVKKASKPLNKNFKIYFLFGMILLAALVLRLAQPDWYNDRQFHPDERWIVGSAVPMIKYWGDKPIGLQYGSLPLYLLSTYNGGVTALRNAFFPRMDMNKALIGGARAISGLISTGTIVFIFLTCLVLFRPGVALLAAALMAFTTLDIHAAHFFTTDPFISFFVSISIYFCAKIYKKGKLIDYILAGVFYGAAIASKTAALPFAAAIFVAHILHFVTIKGSSKRDKEKKTASWVNFAWAVTAVVITFFICMPHAILDYPKFAADQDYQKRILITGEGDVPYNRQYIDTPKYIFYIENMIKYTMGIPYGTMAFIAFFFYIFIFFRDLKDGRIGNREILIILAGLVPYFLIVGFSFAKFNRYMVPMTPFLALLTAKLLFDIRDRLKEKKIGTALIAVVLGGAMFYGIAFMNVYANSHSWIESSRWMFKNIPAVTADIKGAPHRTRVLNEMWGDDLPVWADGRGGETYENLKWNVQEPDSPNKIEELSNMLSFTDYVAMADKRAYGTYQRLPKRYPINYFYYTTMLKNADILGYKLVYEKVNYPSLFGITINDDKADESFQLYDHPKVYIFKNEKYFTKEQLKQILLDGSAKITQGIGAATGGATGALKEIGSDNPNIGKIRDAVKGVIPQLSIVFWYLLIQLLAMMMMPLNMVIFKNLKDKGYGLAKIAGLFFFAWINWLLVSMNVWNFYQMNLWILLAILFGVSAFFSIKNRPEITAFTKSNRGYIIAAESIFLAAYLLFIIVKLWAPDIHNVAGHGYNGGGEPMGLAYLSAIYNDVKFPPHDPWMSGFTLNYYYWGQLILATASKLLGYLPKVTYNLSLAILFALCFISAFSLAYNMTGKKRYGVLAGFLLACAGNFHTLVFIIDKMINSPDIRGFLGGVFSFQFIWDPTRIYPSPVITELPFFSYLYGDLHAHNIVIPVTVLAIALIYNVMKSPNKELSLYKNLGSTPAEIALTSAALSVTVGSMLAINTWNFPPVVITFGLALGMLAFMLYRENSKQVMKMKTPVKLKTLGGFGADIAATMAVILAVAWAAFVFFHLNFHSPYKAALGHVTRPEQAGVFVVFEYFSIFFIIISAWMFQSWASGFETFLKKTGLSKIRNFNSRKTGKMITKGIDRIFDNPPLFLRFLSGLIVAALFILLLFIQTAFAFLFVMIVTCVWMLFKAKSREEALALVLVFVSLCIVVGTELFYIADGRMNTVFKFYMVAWTLLALSVPYLAYMFMETFKKQLKLKKFDGLIAAGSAIAFLVIQGVLAFVDNRTGNGFARVFFIMAVFAAPLLFVILRDRVGKAVLAGAFIYLLVPAVLYPVLGSLTKMSICSSGFSQAPRIDGTKYMSRMEQRPGSTRDFDKYDYDSIEWINKNFKQIEPILEAPGENMYSGVSRISIFTGMPTLIGWGYQVSQQSGRDTNTRNINANYIYGQSTVEEALNVLKTYNIKYVYMGTIERSMYNNPMKFAGVADVVYSNAGATLYKIR